MGKYTCFSHRECEFFPCHEGADKDNFNCLFCYCPLYSLGKRCGGEFVYLPNGVKDCSGCLFPHRKENYRTVIEKLTDSARTMAEKKEKGDE